jgi:replicative DNA helicase
MQADKGKYGLTPRMELPLWFVGKGIMDARESGYQRIPLTVEVMEQTLNEIVQFDKQTEKKPSLLIVDYLQRVQGKNEDDISNQVRRIANALSDFASTYNVPVLIGAQAGRDTDRQLDKTPLMGSSRHSAEFEDMVDKLLAIWRPVTSEKRGSAIDVAGRPYVVDDDLMKVVKWKDREGAANVPFAFPFNMETLKSGEYEQ